MSLTDLSSCFRDEAQRRRAQGVIQERLADDREQDECRYLVRFVWQLAMTYPDVSLRELRSHVSVAKLEAVEALIEAARCSSPDLVDIEAPEPGPAGMLRVGIVGPAGDHTGLSWRV